MCKVILGLNVDRSSLSSIKVLSNLIMWLWSNLARNRVEFGGVRTMVINHVNLTKYCRAW